MILLSGLVPLLAFVLLHLVTPTQAFYLPGLAPVNFCKKTNVSSTCKSEIILYVNRLNTEESEIPYEYHNFDFCLGEEANSPVENLGQVVFGERIRPGPYKIQFLENQQCTRACTKNYKGDDPVSNRRMMVLKKGISLNYQHHWIVDNMPVTWCYPLENGKQYCETGFPMGCLVRNDGEGCPINSIYNQPLHYYPFNHVDLEITYHSGQAEDWGIQFGNSGRIISVKVTPKSIKHADPENPNCLGSEPLAISENSLKAGEQLNIVYTYSVKFIKNDAIKWSSRWDYIPESTPHTNIQ